MVTESTGLLHIVNNKAVKIVPSTQGDDDMLGLMIEMVVALATTLALGLQFILTITSNLFKLNGYV